MQVDPQPTPVSSVRALAERARRSDGHLRDVSIGRLGDVTAEPASAHPEIDRNRTARGIALGLAICIAGWAVAGLVWWLLS